MPLAHPTGVVLRYGARASRRLALRRRKTLSKTAYMNPNLRFLVPGIIPLVLCLLQACSDDPAPVQGATAHDAGRVEGADAHASEDASTDRTTDAPTDTDAQACMPLNSPFISEPVTPSTLYTPGACTAEEIRVAYGCDFQSTNVCDQAANANRSARCDRCLRGTGADGGAEGAGPYSAGALNDPGCFENSHPGGGQIFQDLVDCLVSKCRHCEAAPDGKCQSEAHRGICKAQSDALNAFRDAHHDALDCIGVAGETPEARDARIIRFVTRWCGTP